MQLIGYNIVNLAKKDIDEVSLKHAIEIAEEDFKNDVCGTTISVLSEKDFEFLKAMSKDKSMSNLSQIAKRLGVTTDCAQKYRKRLINAGIIEPATRGSVKFSVPLLADYLKDDKA